MRINQNLGLKIPKELQNSKPVVNESQKLGKNEFMKLLMAEMRNQDPLEPKSNTESIAQMAQFSALEQASSLNKAFENFAKMQQSSSLATSAHVIGKYASIQDGDKEISGLIKSSFLKEGEVYVKIQMEDEKIAPVKLSNIISLSMEKPEKKSYRKLPISNKTA